MSKALIQIRNGIDDVYGDLIETSESDTLTVDEIMIAVKSRLNSEIERYQSQLVDATLGRLIHEVGRRKGDRGRKVEFGDLFSGYKRIPQSVLIDKNRRKPTEKLSIKELEAYIEEHSRKALNRHHEEFRRLIADCKEFSRTDSDTLEVLLKRRAEALARV